MSHSVGSDAGDGLVLRPFRGLRYAPERVDPGAVTSPPYDVIGAEQARRLEAREPHNLVRLTLPDTSADAGSRYARAARLLREWLAEGVLVRDDTPALYVYEERHGDSVHRGLLGAVALRAPEERVVLPHEEVHQGPVADRLAQMETTFANLEPIYLLVPGLGVAADVVDAAAAAPPLVCASSLAYGEPAEHRLWAITDDAALTTVADALHDRQALIADGHHRYTAYRELQARRHAAGYGPGPWDYGLAFVLDSVVYPPTLQPIHRVVAQLPPDKLLAALPADAVVGDAVRALGDLPAAAGDADSHRFVVAGDGRYRQVTLPRRPSTAGHSLCSGLDVAVLQHLLEDTMQVPDEHLTFLHDATAAVTLAAEQRGTVVLLEPPRVTDVHALAAAGERMPRKSTSFGPKPLGGLVLRTLAP